MGLSRATDERAIIAAPARLRYFWSLRSIRRSGHQPDDGDDHVQGEAEPGRDKGQRNAHRIARSRNPALAVHPDRLGQRPVFRMMPREYPRQDAIRHRRHHQHEAISDDGRRAKMVLPHPGRHKRHQGEPEQQMQIGPQGAAADLLHQVQHVVVVVPIDADVDETEHVADEDGQQRQQSLKAAPCGTFSSSTMMVMMMAMTPSLKASSLFLPICSSV